MYLPKPGKSQNEPKRAETAQNFEIGEICNFLLVLVFQIFSPITPIQAFWAKKYQFSNLLTKSSMYPISKVLISNLKFFFQILSPNAQFGHFGSKSINFLILTKFPLYLVSKVLISNRTFAFKDFELKYLSLGHLGQKVLTF